jgi:hypothetical protein
MVAEEHITVLSNSCYPLVSIYVNKTQNARNDSTWQQDSARIMISVILIRIQYLVFNKTKGHFYFKILLHVIFNDFE